MQNGERSDAEGSEGERSQLIPDAKKRAGGIGAKEPSLWALFMRWGTHASAAAALFAVMALLLVGLLYRQPPDLIIIGAGPAGSSIAYEVAQLSPRTRVLILEAGGASQRATGGNEYLYNNMTVFDVPLAWSYVAQISRLHWTVLGDQAIIAKAVGGCGIHNAMLYVRALPQDIIGWNMSAWNWPDYLGTYLELEHFMGPLKDSDIHAVGGPTAVSPPIHRDMLGEKFLETAANLGHPISDDFNVPGQRVGAGMYHFNIRNGVRDGAAATLLAPTLARPGGLVKLQTHAQVDRLEFVGATAGEARRGLEGGKRVSRIVGTGPGGQPWSLSVGKRARVVLAAGALNTPALLLKSGVGPREKVHTAGFADPVVDLPALGRGIQDHPAVGMLFEVNPPLIADMASVFREFVNWTAGHKLEKYPLAFGYPGFSTGAFLRSGVGNDDLGTPDLQLTVFPVTIEPHLARPEELHLSYDRVLVTVAAISPDTRFSLKLTKRQKRTRRKNAPSPDDDALGSGPAEAGAEAGAEADAGGEVAAVARAACNTGVELLPRLRLRDRSRATASSW